MVFAYRTSDAIRADIIASSGRLLDMVKGAEDYEAEYVKRDRYLSELFALGYGQPA